MANLDEVTERSVIGSGGSGNDTFNGGVDHDILEGGSGDDTLSGGGDRDHVLGGSGNDFVSGGDDRDIVRGGSGNDVVDGGMHDDFSSRRHRQRPHHRRPWVGSPLRRRRQRLSSRAARETISWSAAPATTL